ncbi:hypothetical protein [Natronorarus salvus]|uniref:hypothetical protein n=1 Tax=Natronorarus salvus TaxID=3117733 RepID=UPI002F26B96B
MSSDTRVRGPERDGGLPPRGEAPGRKTRPAYTDRRQIWYGMGKRGSDEKGTVAQLLHDVPTLFAEVFVLGFPAIAYVYVADFDGGAGLSGPTFVLWITMTAVGTAIHAGLVRPPFTEFLGWVTLSPSLVVLRVVYYNLVLIGGVHASAAIGSLAGDGTSGLVAAVAIGTFAMLVFPALADAVARRRG